MFVVMSIANRRVIQPMTKIQHLRQYYGLRQKDFAEKCKVGQTTIQLIEKGNRTRTSTAQLIAEFLELPIRELFVAGTNPRYLYPIHTFEVGDKI